MASAEQSLPTCPVCKRSDQVKTMQAAYNTGVARCAPPEMPTRNVSMMKTMISAMFGVGIFIFLIIVFVGGLETQLPFIWACILLGLTVAAILTTLFFSFRAFQSVVHGDIETTIRYPAWDNATAIWRSLFYCSRDNVVFNPKTGAIVNDEELAALGASSESTQEFKALATSH